MKKIFLFFMMVSAMSISAQQVNFNEQVDDMEETSSTEETVSVSKLHWLTNLEEAKKQANKENKNIILFFTGSDWCAPCIALKDDYFNTPAFEDNADKFVLLLIDYPRRKDIISPEQMKYNRTIIDKYNKSKSFPKVVMVSKGGRELGKISGYSSFNSYKDISHHEKFINKYL
ncbi:thioredoxin family protein [Patiriisocius marinus]|nr:thioredoxin family protein [Patiriisocius marinus]